MPGKLTDKYMENLKQARNLSTGTPPKFFSAILYLVALVYNCYFFQNSRFRFHTNTVTVLTRLPTRQDGVENRVKVYYQ